MSIIEESLYRITGARLNESFDRDEIISKLISKFGKDFNKSSLCSEVCDYIENVYPNLDKVECAVYISDGVDYIPISTNHSVIRDGNILLDFTNQQYNNYDEYGNNTDVPRIFKQLKNNIYTNGNMILECKYI